MLPLMFRVFITNKLHLCLSASGLQPMAWHNTKGRSEGKDIRCPHCNCAHCPVRHTEKREVTYGGQTRTITRRKRVCRNCECPFTTVETYESEDDIGFPDLGTDSPPKPQSPPLPSSLAASESSPPKKKPTQRQPKSGDTPQPPRNPYL